MTNSKFTPAAGLTSSGQNRSLLLQPVVLLLTVTGSLWSTGLFPHIVYVVCLNPLHRLLDRQPHCLCAESSDSLHLQVNPTFSSPEKLWHVKLYDVLEDQFIGLIITDTNGRRNWLTQKQDHRWSEFTIRHWKQVLRLLGHTWCSYMLTDGYHRGTTVK